MKAYKFVNSKYFKKRTFRLGTLWDYRKEELYGSAIGDRGEGTYQIEFSQPFAMDNDFAKRISENQPFSAACLKGHRSDDDDTKYFATLSAQTFTDLARLLSIRRNFSRILTEQTYV